MYDIECSEHLNGILVNFFDYRQPRQSIHLKPVLL